MATLKMPRRARRVKVVQMYKNPDSLEPGKVHLKYVVSYNHATERFFVDVVASWRFHSDCHVPEGFKIMSAGWLSVPADEYKDSNPANAKTWGGSEGYQVGPHSRDLAMLKQFVQHCENTFSREGVAVDFDA
jgi:hypothetical protein